MRYVAATSTSLRSEASERGAASSVVLELPPGSALEVVGHDPSGVWSRALYAPDGGGVEDGLLGYVPTRDIEADLPASLLARRSNGDVRSSAGTLAFALTRQFDGVRYRLGAKAEPEPSGFIDCSGWTAYLAFRVMDFANAELGRRVFSFSDKKLANTYSDAQIKNVRDVTGYVARNQTLRDLSLPLYLIGLNFGNYEWEANANRVYGIDHVVMTVLSDGGDLMVSQSSSSGGGVNLVPYGQWYDAVSGKPMYGVDLMLLGSWLIGLGDDILRDLRDRFRREDFVVPDPDTRDALPG
jgi:hypothetical protein